MRKLRYPAVLGLVLGLVGVVVAADTVAPRGGSTGYPVKIEVAVNGQAVQMNLTGAALRTRLFVNVYTVASYLQAGVEAKSAEALADADVHKRLHIVMERDVSGADMGEALKSAIRANYAEPMFAAEVNTLLEQMKPHNLRKGDSVILSHIPGVGFVANVVGKGEITIKNPKFSRAVWDIYLGKKNLGEDIKTSMTNRL